MDKLLKLNSGNTKLLVQKHRLLGDAVQETKLKSLEAQANQSATALQKIASDGEKLKTILSKDTGQYDTDFEGMGIRRVIDSINANAMAA